MLPTSGVCCVSLGRGIEMSRSKPGYDKECSGAKKMWRRKRRNEGKRLMQDDNPDKGTQGWLTN